MKGNTSPKGGFIMSYSHDYYIFLPIYDRTMDMKSHLVKFATIFQGLKDNLDVMAKRLP